MFLIYIYTVLVDFIAIQSYKYLRKFVILDWTLFKPWKSMNSILQSCERTVESVFNLPKHI